MQPRHDVACISDFPGFSILADLPLWFQLKIELKDSPFILQGKSRGTTWVSCLFHAGIEVPKANIGVGFLER